MMASMTLVRSTLMQQINIVYEGTRKYDLACIIRNNWFPAMRLLAYRMNGYLSKSPSVTLNQINGFLERKHMCRDDIHMNALGYSVFIEKGLGQLLESHYN